MSSSIEKPLAALREDIMESIYVHAVPAIRGPAGVGKTAMIADIARSMNMRLHVEIGSMSEPTDIAGFPVVSHHTRKVNNNGRWLEVPELRFAPREWMLTANESTRPTLIFLDEFNSVPSQTRGPLLRMIQSGEIGDMRLDPQKVVFIIAYNPTGEAVNGSDLEFPMVNRLDHYDYPMEPGTVEEWCENFPGYWGHANDITFGTDDTVTRIGSDALIRARSFVAGYLRRNPDQWHYTMIAKNKPGKKEKEGEAVAIGNEFPTSGAPTPRSWERVANHLARTLETNQPAFTAGRRITAAIGTGVGVAFLAYLKETNLPDPRALLADPESYVPRGRLDIDFSVLMSVATVTLSANPVDPTTYLAALKIANIAHSGGTGPKKDKPKATEAAFAAVRHIVDPITSEGNAFVKGLVDRHVAKYGPGKVNDFNRDMAKLIQPFQALLTKMRRGE